MPVARSFPVAPDSVYVWRGFKSASLSYVQFVQFLGTVFVPACALLQPRIGLRAYIPTLVPQASKPAAVPDQTALMFWSVPAAHDQAKLAIAERIYMNLHGDVYDMNRSKLQEVPKSLDLAATTLEPEQPYYLLSQPADWMQGQIHHLVGARRPDLAVNDFLTAACTWAQTFRASWPTEVDSALVCCGNDYVVAWLHSAGGNTQLHSLLDGLAALTVPVLSADANPLKLEAELWDDWPGFDLTQAACLNIEFHRPAAASPRKRGTT